MLGELCVKISAASGFPEDQVRVLVCLLLAYPIALLHRRIPGGPLGRSALSAAVGIFYAFFTLGREGYHSVLTSLTAYLMLRFVPTRTAAPLVVFFSMGYLTYLHLYRMIYHYGSWEMDATAPQMVLTIKLTSIAFNMLDGTRPDEELMPRQRKMAVRKCPSAVDFLGYTFFFGSFLAGPACEYRDYETFNDRSEFAPKGDPPGSARAALRNLLCGLACGVGVVLYGMYNTEHLPTDWFSGLPLYQRWLYLNLAISLSRYRYYLCWFIAEGSCTMAGLGYGGEDPKQSGSHRWDRLAQVNFWGVELGQSFKQLTDSWNIRTGVWLKEYVYMRVPHALGELPRIMATHLTSALWHGLYPGYFMFYVCMSFSIETGRRLRRSLRWRVVATGSKALKAGYDAAGWLAVLTTTNYFCGAFLLLDYNLIMRYWTSTYFAYHFAVIAALALTFVVTPEPRAQKEIKVE